MSDKAIEHARAGLYAEAAMREVGEERRRRFFVKSERGWRVAKALRELCVFARNDVAHDPPFSRLDLVSCRNVLAAPVSEPPLQRALVLAFPHAGHRSTQRCTIPRCGMLLGRGTAAFEAPFSDPGMSIRHAEVRIEGGGAVVRDLGSAAGTRLNGEPLQEPHALVPGDVLRMGDTLLVYARSAGPDEEEASASSEPELTGASASIGRGWTALVSPASPIT